MWRKVIKQKPMPGASPQVSDTCEVRAGLTSDVEVLAAIFESIEQSVENDFLYGESLRRDVAGTSPTTIRGVKLSTTASSRNKPRRTVIAKRIKRLLTSGDAR